AGVVARHGFGELGGLRGIGDDGGVVVGAGGQGQGQGRDGQQGGGAVARLHGRTSRFFVFVLRRRWFRSSSTIDVGPVGRTSSSKRLRAEHVSLREPFQGNDR